MIALIVCGVLAMAVVGIGAGVIFHRVENGLTRMLAFGLGAAGVLIGLIAALVLGSPDP